MIETIIIALLALFLAFIAGYLILIYNGLIRLKNNIEKSWSNIDVLLKQRHDELDNILVAVKGYMKYEKSLFLSLAHARALMMKASTVNDKAKANDAMDGSIKSLFMAIENYPQLKANENVLQLQKRITDIENMIADRREFYNDSVTIYNTRVDQIPYVFVARMLKYQSRELFKA